MSFQGCGGDWIVPTTTTSSTPYHESGTNYYYQTNAFPESTTWITYTWPETKEYKMKIKDLVEVLDEAFHICPDCDGEETIYEQVEDEGGLEVYKKVPCPRCNGKGRILSHEGIKLRKELKRLLDIIILDDTEEADE